MTKLLTKILSSIFIAAAVGLLPLAYGCGSAETDRTLRRADSLIMASPDSALALLQSLTPPQSGEKQARYNLLTAKAAAKAHRNIADEKPLQIAAKYFAGRGDSLETQSYYYLAAALWQQRKYAESILTAQKAEKTALENEDWFFAAMAERNLGDIYGSLLAIDKALEYYALAIDKFRKTGKDAHALWETINYANKLRDISRSQEALAILDSIKPECEGDMGIMRHFYTIRSLVYNDLGMHRETVTDLHRFMENGGRMDSQLYAVACSSYLSIGDVPKADAYFDSALCAATSLLDTLRAQDIKAEILFRQGKAHAAYVFNRRVQGKTASIISQKMTQPYMALVNETFEKELEKEKAIASKAEERLMLCIVILLLLAMITFLILTLQRGKIRKQRGYLETKDAEITEGMMREADLLASLERMKAELAEQITAQQMQAECTEGKQQQYHIDVKKVYGKYLNLLDSLFKEWYFLKGSNDAERFFGEKVKKKLSKIEFSEIIEESEAVINEYNDNMMANLRIDYPELSEAQLQLIIFSILGLSKESIMVLTKRYNASSFRVSRFRLKKTLLSKRSAAGERVIKALGLY